MKKIIVVYFLLPLAGLIYLTYPNFSFAKTDISISESDIIFSNSEPLAGESIKIYVRVFNLGDTDAYGDVMVSIKDKQTSNSQPVSLRPGTYDDIFITWQAETGLYDITAELSNLSSVDENTENNKAIKKDFFVDLDTDKDGTGDKKDADDDNDGLTDEEETNKNTNPLLADTDGDNVNDKIDTFALDNSEWRDTDGDKIGDNKDVDADGDGLSNQEEISDHGTNPLSQDSDGDGIIDSKDEFPLDKSKAGASLMDSITALINAKNSPYLFIAIPFAIIILFLLFRRKKRRT